MNARSENVERFAAEAEQFEQWAKSGSDTGAEAARNGLLRITRLYAAALELPALKDNSEYDTNRVEDAEWRVVLAIAARLPFDYYGEVFNPLPVPPEAPCVGSLADDIADIYRDVVSGLRTYRAGRPNLAVEQWTFWLESHWGEHATSAIRALHCWLARNDPGWLSASSKQ